MSQVRNKIVARNKVNLSVLKKRRDFLRIARGRLKWVSKTMIVQVAVTPEEDKLSRPHTGPHIRVGYTASKKVGNAVRRNRAKRRLRRVVRDVLPGGGRAGYDYVLIARTADAEPPYDQLIRDFSWCLKRLNPLNHLNSLSGKNGGKTGLSSPETRLERMKK